MGFMMNGRRKTLLKYSLCLALILITLLIADPRALVEAIVGADLSLIWLVVILYVLNLVVKSYRWSILMQSTGEKVPFRTVFVNYSFCQAINNITPGRVAGEATRIYGVNSKNGVRLGAGTASVVTERLMDLTMVTVAAITGMVLLGPVLMDGLLDQLYVAVAVAAAANILIIYVMTKPKLLRRAGMAVIGVVGKIAPGRWGETAGQKLTGFLGSFTDAMTYSHGRTNKKAYLAAGALTVVVWTNEIARVCLIMEALGASINIAAVVVVTSLSALSAVLLIAGSGNIVISSAIFSAVGVDIGIAAGAGVLSALTSIWLSIPISLLAMIAVDRRAGKAGTEAEPRSDQN